MPHPWLSLRHPLLPPAENMAWDDALLETAGALGQPVLRFYGWASPAATFGYFQKFAAVECLTTLRPLLRRPTGGGLVPHDADWTYSAVLPPNDPWYSLRAVDSYRRMHEWIRAAFAELNLATELSPGGLARAEGKGMGQCFVGAEPLDVLWQGRKLAGAAQRRSRSGLLIQGSIQPPAGLERIRFETAMLTVARRVEGVAWEELTPGPALIARALELAKSKYARAEFHRRR